MNKYIFNIAVALLVLGMVVSCSSDDGDEGSSSSVTGGGNGSSSSKKQNSSSSGVEYTGGSCDIKDYKAVPIGKQVWMAKNLDCDVPGSNCYDDDPANCAKYGRLYTWATALGLDTKYNKERWGEKGINMHKGICPAGWHIPSIAEWDTLMAAIGGYDTAGKFLKATSGWNDDEEGKSGNGQDTYGFAALPGGSRLFNFEFGGIGEAGRWWSASEYNAAQPTTAPSLGMGNNGEKVYKWNNDDKGILHSVRCVQDNVVPDDSITLGDNIYYRTVVIGSQTWMAKNMNYDEKKSSRCYDDEPANCTKYGRLYDWATAMGLPSECNEESCANLINTKHRGICLYGWHIPSSEEWQQLGSAVGGGGKPNRLMTPSGWNVVSFLGTDGTDDYGFSALPGGSAIWYDESFSFNNVGNSGTWWSSTDHDSENYACSYYLSSVNMGLGDCRDNKKNLHSVRCVKD